MAEDFSTLDLGSSMKLYRQIFLFWLPILVINIAGLSTLPESLSVRMSRIVLTNVSGLLGIVSLFLFRREIIRSRRFFFLILAALFLLNGLVFGLFHVCKHWIIYLDDWSEFYEYQYAAQAYFLLLSGCITYLVIDLSFGDLKSLRKLMLASVLVGGVWGYLFYPYFVNPKYLYSTPDIEDYRSIRAAMNELQSGGERNSSVELIASLAMRYGPKSDKLGIQCSKENREARVTEVLPYFRGDDVNLLIYRPLWQRQLLMALLSLALILAFILYQYLADPPKSAYLEKILWCLLPYCSFEALHYCAFIHARAFDEFVILGMYGTYASVGVMIPFLALLMLRLRFIETVEGRFYEHRLIQNPSRITRWRDSFDNWILRQFMSTKELEHRFLIQPEESVWKDITHGQS